MSSARAALKNVGRQRLKVQQRSGALAGQVWSGVSELGHA